jgi:predicted secreted Zn-dependent protease
VVERKRRFRPAGRFRWLPAAAALGCAAATSGGGFASGGVFPDPAIHVRERVAHYDVEGATVDEILGSLHRGALSTPDGRFQGLTHWNVRWRYRFAPRAGGCAIVDSDVTLEVTITVPRWTNTGRATPEVEEWWDRYITSLQHHEAGHRDIAVLAANEVLSTLQGLRTATCAGIRDEANARGRWVLERHRRMSRDYDERTRHGRETVPWNGEEPEGR